MSENNRSGIGLLIPAAAVIGFVLALTAEQYLMGIVFAVAGILVWFLYMAVMETSPPEVTGNIIVVFGVLLALAVFMAYGWDQNIFGGLEIKTEGTIMALIVLFFSVLLGTVFRRGQEEPESAPQLTEKEELLVQKALEDEENGQAKVIVIKQEEQEEPKEEEDDEWEYDEEYPYMYAYPPEYYEFDEEEYEEED